MQYRPFIKKHRIKFSECDPAGIVFYPQYFIMFNDLVEDWIDTILPCTYSGLIGKEKVGLPTVHLDVNFRAVSKMGDDVLLKVTIKKLGNRSINLHLECWSEDGELRMEVDQVIVTTSLITHQAIEIPEFLRKALNTYQITE